MHFIWLFDSIHILYWKCIVLITSKSLALFFPRNCMSHFPPFQWTYFDINKSIWNSNRTVNYAKKSSFLLPCILFRLWYFNFEPSFKLRWCRAQDLFGLQTPVATGGFVLVITCLREKFGIYLLSLHFWNFEISRVKRGFKALKELAWLTITQKTVNQYQQI